MSDIIINGTIYLYDTRERAYTIQCAEQNCSASKMFVILCTCRVNELVVGSSWTKKLVLFTGKIWQFDKLIWNYTSLFDCFDCSQLPGSSENTHVFPPKCVSALLKYTQRVCSKKVLSDFSTAPCLQSSIQKLLLNNHIIEYVFNQTVCFTSENDIDTVSTAIRRNLNQIMIKS